MKIGVVVIAGAIASLPTIARAGLGCIDACTPATPEQTPCALTPGALGCSPIGAQCITCQTDPDCQVGGQGRCNDGRCEDTPCQLGQLPDAGADGGLGGDGAADAGGGSDGPALDGARLDVGGLDVGRPDGPLTDAAAADGAAPDGGTVADAGDDAATGASDATVIDRPDRTFVPRPPIEPRPAEDDGCECRSMQLTKGAPLATIGGLLVLSLRRRPRKRGGRSARRAPGRGPDRP